MNIEGTFIPRKIKAGFDIRKDGKSKYKLAYVIYYDENNKLRKEKSWNNWRDVSIDPVDEDNVPLDGFKIHSLSKGHFGDWFAKRLDHIRVEDPRGWVFEINVDNLLYILNSTNVVNKNLEGKFFYGWYNTELILIPANAKEFKDVYKNSEKVFNNEFVPVSSFVPGCVYKRFSGELEMYIGTVNGTFISSAKKEIQVTPENKEKIENLISKGWVMYDSTSLYDISRNIKIFRKSTTETRHVFLSLGKKYKEGDPIKIYTSYSIEYEKNPKKRFVECVIDTPSAKFPKVFDYLNHDGTLSPIDESKTERYSLTKEEFKSIFKERARYYDLYSIMDGEYVFRTCERDFSGVYEIETDDAINYSRGKDYRLSSRQKTEKFDNVEDILKKYKFFRVRKYCKNGNFSYESIKKRDIEPYITV